MDTDDDDDDDDDDLMAVLEDLYLGCVAFLCCLERQVGPAVTPDSSKGRGFITYKIQTDASTNSLWTLAAADMDKLSGLLGDGVVGDMVEEQIREKAADVAGETRPDPS